MRKLLTSLLVFLGISVFPVQAEDSLAQFNRFLSEINAYSAEFDQVVLDENLRQIDEASGTLTILRPGRFRWDYYPPAEQQIIGDGERVWIYDLELRQVIVRDQQASLGHTPAILLAGRKLDSGQYTLEDRGLQGKVNWVRLVPRTESSGFEEIQVGFVDSILSTMVLVDGLGQTTRINFNNGVENPSLPEAQFSFTPPDDVDVIDETQ